MRCTQIYGLTEEARRFLDENCKKETNEKCPNCGHIISEKLASQCYKDVSNTGMFEDGPFLMKYFLKDGKVANEIIQATPWSSGPCIFMCLEIEGKKMFEWSQEEIDKC